MADRPLLKETLFMLNFVGLDPCKQSTFSEVRFFVTLALLSFCCVNTLLECLLRWDGLNSNEALSLSITIYLISMQLGSKAMKFMVAFMCIILPGYLVQPIFGKARKLFLPSYYPENLNQSPQFEVVFAVQSAYLIPVIVSLLSIDGFFVSLIINIASELKLVRKGFQDVPIALDIKADSRNTLQCLYLVIDHHNLTLRCIKIVRNIFSVSLLNAYACTIILICGGLIGIIATGFPPTLVNVYKYGSFSFFYILEFLFYCVTGTYLTRQSECISSAIYDTKWWIKTQPEVRRACVFVIQRANKVECLTAGGMYALNLDSFGSVLKNSLSFFTLVQAVYGDSITN